MWRVVCCSYDCQARVWYKRDVNKLQRWMDKCYRYVWSDRNGEPFRQMAERHVNMTDVKQRLGIKSVEWKIERRVLERIGHVMRMGNERLTKAVVLGRWEGLEGRGKMAGRKRKTVLYWRRVLREICALGSLLGAQRESHRRTDRPAGPPRAIPLFFQQRSMVGTRGGG